MTLRVQWVQEDPGSGENPAPGYMALYARVSDGHIISRNSSGVEIDLTATIGMTGPGSATDNALARFDGISGNIAQNSVAILDDAGILTGLAEIVISDHR